MKYLLDTCIISEFTKPQPNAQLIQWLRVTPMQHLYMSVLSIGEIQKGVSRLEVSIRQQTLQTWLDDDVTLQFSGRILDLDEQINRVWGQLCGQSEIRGKTLSVIDSLLAATAIARQMTLVTRNEKDFLFMLDMGLNLLNPWNIV